MMVLLYCLVGLLIFASGFQFGRLRQRLKDQKEIDQHTEYLKRTLYQLIAFGMQKGFPFEQIQEIEEREKNNVQLSQRDHLYLSLKIALEEENYEEASILRDKIVEYEKGNNN